MSASTQWRESLGVAAGTLEIDSCDRSQWADP